MELRGTEFGHIAGGSGVQGFFGHGDEYPHHRLLAPLGLLDFTGMTFVAKTVTLEPWNVASTIRGANNVFGGN